MSDVDDENGKSSDSDSTSRSSSDDTMEENCWGKIQVPHFEVNHNKALKKALHEPSNIEQIVQDNKH